MTWPRRYALPYQTDASVYFSKIQHLAWPIWLDSGYPAQRKGRYDILVAEPIEQLTLDVAAANELGLRLRQALQNRDQLICDLPFCGGWIGYLGYEFGRAWMGQAGSRQDPLAQAIRAGLYDWALVIDHYRQTGTLVGMGTAQSTRNNWAALCQMLDAQALPAIKPKPQSASNVQYSTSYSDYAQQFQQIQHYIHAGDAYQVNLTQRFQAQTEEDSWSLYQRLRQANPAHHAAYLGFDDYQILSSSPEQFVSLQNGIVTTRPIKGTRPRGITPQQDTQMCAELAASAKDRAENLMIVDLLRNDLGKVCVPGSITVPALFSLESYSSVHHLVSTVEGELRADKDAIDLLKACFPGGSITGAPKKRAMQIIDELEPIGREIYCGSIFRLGFDGNLDSNISIRSILKKDSTLYYWSGGGIVADSNCADEYQESLDKARIFFDLTGIPAHNQMVNSLSRAQNCLLKS